MTRRAVVLVMAVAMACPLAAAPVTRAIFVAAPGGTAVFSTGTLAAATSLHGMDGTVATLSWAPSTSTGAAGYLLLRSATSGTGYAQVGTVSPVSATVTTDAPGNGTWYYVLQTYLQSWTSGSSNETSVLVGSSRSTGYRGCASTSAETSGSGDNDGYEGNPNRACSFDGAVATDANSGTGTSTSCTSARKDRHRFWGYSFGMPGSVTSIDGITVQLAAGIDSTTGTNRLCVQLSPDGGTTWTTARTVNLASTAITRYTLGGDTDLWGHDPWTLSQLGPSTFRVRITDVSSSNNRDFRLDYLGVQVTYTP